VERAKRVAAEELLRGLALLAGGGIFLVAARLLGRGLIWMGTGEEAAGWTSWGAYWFCVSAMHGLHAFAYRWTAWPLGGEREPPSLARTLAFLDAHLLYFAAFGSVLAATLASLPLFEGAALYAAVFPFLVLQTIAAKPHRTPTPAPLNAITLFGPLFAITGRTLSALASTRAHLIHIVAPQR
jgi:hypothetical protein